MVWAVQRSTYSSSSSSSSGYLPVSLVPIVPRTSYIPSVCLRSQDDDDDDDAGFLLAGDSWTDCLPCLTFHELGVRSRATRAEVYASGERAFLCELNCRGHCWLGWEALLWWTVKLDVPERAGMIQRRVSLRRKM